MPIINVNNMVVDKMLVDYRRNAVTVFYFMLDSTGAIYGGEHVVTYWAVLPSNPGPADYLLPANYVTTFANLLIAATAAIKSKEGI